MNANSPHRAYPDETLFCQTLIALSYGPGDGVRNLGSRLLARALRTSI
ncbi:MAG: hypothetical protein JNL45_02095 [Hyphomicrobium sp.]|nr:hypothetical protein [Hyphomicrobium sp.]